MADKQYPNIKRVISQASHRNGSGGAGFIVSIFEPDDVEDRYEGPFVAISMDPDMYSVPLSQIDIQHYGSVRAAKVARKLREFETHTAVLNIAETVNGNIGFAEGNSWRGTTWGRGLAEAWRDACLEGRAYNFPMSNYDPFDDETYLDEKSGDEQLKAVVEQATEDYDTTARVIESFQRELAIFEQRMVEAETAQREDTGTPAPLTDEEESAILTLAENPLLADLAEAARARVSELSQ
jgi:hypothetical protein